MHSQGCNTHFQQSTLQ